MAFHPTVLDDQALDLRSDRAATPLRGALLEMQPGEQKQDGCNPKGEARREHGGGTFRIKADVAIYLPQELSGDCCLESCSVDHRKSFEMVNSNFTGG
ncbi:hypothetical protein ACLBXO_08495 [Methylobacterium sp. C33D]